MDKLFDFFDEKSNFTKLMDESLTEFNIDDPNVNEIVDFLNIAENFRTFADGLTNFIAAHGYEGDLEDIKAKTDFLFNKIGTQKIGDKDLITKVTIKNWFSAASRPANNFDARKNIFIICFALNLSVNEAAKFFSKVYFDRYFNFRNKEEVIYFYCLNNNLSYAYAYELIQKVDSLKDSSPTIDNNKTMHTNLMGMKIQTLKDEDSLIDYIISNEYNFSKNNITAKANFERLLEEAKKLACEESEFFDIDTENMSKSSVDFALFIIHGINFVAVESERKSYTFTKHAKVLNIIKEKYPSNSTFSNIAKDTSVTYDMLRKAIILLSFYTFWFKNYLTQYKTKKQLDGDMLFDMFVSNTNDILYESGLNLLYSGNPFDWLFMFSSKTESPLNTFREIISEVYYTEDEE